jgi:hypothetical protein
MPASDQQVNDKQIGPEQKLGAPGDGGEIVEASFGVMRWSPSGTETDGQFIGLRVNLALLRSVWFRGSWFVSLD